MSLPTDLIVYQVFLDFGFVLNRNRLGEITTSTHSINESIQHICVSRIPERPGAVKIQFLTLIVSHSERDNRILHEIIERPASHLVQMDQILKISHQSLLPSTTTKHCESVQTRSNLTWQYTHFCVTEYLRNEPLASSS